VIDAPRHFNVLSALAKLLAPTGVYALVPCGVNRRVRAIGIHMAPGADKLDGMGSVLRLVIRPQAIGALLGLAGAGILAMNLSAATSVRLLCGIGLLDPVSFLLLPGFLISVALLASYMPARRAKQGDPMLALRLEWV
jgi:ABC-type lipoprotein release transport system permease subunit